MYYYCTYYHILGRNFFFVCDFRRSKLPEASFSKNFLRFSSSTWSALSTTRRPAGARSFWRTSTSPSTSKSRATSYRPTAATSTRRDNVTTNFLPSSTTTAPKPPKVTTSRTFTTQAFQLGSTAMTVPSNRCPKAWSWLTRPAACPTSSSTDAETPWGAAEAAAEFLKKSNSETKPAFLSKLLEWNRQTCVFGFEWKMQKNGKTIIREAGA